MTTLLHQSNTRRGAVLIIVLWIALGLTSLSVYFGHDMMMEYRAADNALAGCQAEHALEGARRYVAFYLADPEEEEEAGMLPDTDYFAAEAVPVPASTLNGEVSYFWLIGRGDADLATQELTFNLVDESSKLNLNTVTRDMLEGLLEMTPQLAASIIDWRDENEEMEPDGAEAEMYGLLDDPYECKNGDFETLEELRLVFDAEYDLLIGEDTNRNGVLDENENDGDESPPSDNQDGILDCGLLEYLTVHSREPNKRLDGEDRIDVTDGGSASELSSLLEEELGASRAAEIQQAVGQTNNITSVLQYLSRSGMTYDEALLVEDALTVSEDEYLPGLVNINTAPAEVLACLPGLDESIADEIVAYRRGLEIEQPGMAWVLDMLEDEMIERAGPYLTGRTFQYTADIVAVGRNGRGFRRQQFVFDLTDEEPIVVYRRDLSRLGWPLGDDEREALAFGIEGYEEEL